MRICFVAHFAYGSVAGGQGGHIGGVERQVSLMGRWLAEKGHQVSAITWDEGQKDSIEVNGMRILKMCREDAGVKGVRFFWPRWSSLNAAMERANADVYYQNCGEYVTGQVALWCRRRSRKFVYSVANDTDCDIRLPEMHTIRERVLYRYGLIHADSVVVQTHKQQQMLRGSFGRDSVIIPMPCPGPSDEEYSDCVHMRHDSRRVLWIGRICEQKRPDRLLDLAEACPDLHIDFVGPAGGAGYTRNISQRAQSLANVTVYGPVGRDRIPDFYRQARVMCCTSDYEGFPNTFLEAWSWGLPVVSTFDPDSLIASKGLGRVGRNVAELAAGLREMLDPSQQWRKASDAARKYYADNHTVDKAVGRFEQLFRAVADGSARHKKGDL